MKLFAGIDGGQSSTTAVIGDENGTIVGRGSGPPADEVAQTATSTRLHDALALAVGAALHDAKKPHDTSFESVVAGVSGFDGEITGAPPALAARHFELLHDTPIAHAAAFGDGPGVLVIAGTGSVAFGRNAEGEELRLGGWGYLFGDEGSAFWIGRRCVTRAMHEEDFGYPSSLRTAVLAHFGVQNLHELQHAHASGRIERMKIAAFARHAIAMAKTGDHDAHGIVAQAADALAGLGALCARRLHGNKRTIAHPVPLAFSGGLVADDWFARMAAAFAQDRLPEAQLVPMQRTPAEGALLLALQRSKRV